MKFPAQRITTTCAFIFCLTKALAHPGFGHAEESFLQFAAEQNWTVANTNFVSITTEGDSRVIQANGIPDHKMGEFPNRNNPNRISPQSYNFRVPLKPKVAEQPTKLRMQPFGIAVNGVVFDPFAAEWWNDDPSSPWQYEPMNMRGRLGADENNAHVQPGGVYHYHSVPTGLINKLSGGKDKMVLVGWAADGFPIYGPWCYSDANNTNSSLKKCKSSYQLKKGQRPANTPEGKYDGTFVADYEFVKGAGDLDDCNGRVGVTPEFPQGTFYYVLTDDFPFIPRFFKGTPDSSFERRGPPGGGRGPRRGPPGGRRGPPPADRTDMIWEVPPDRTRFAKNRSPLQNEKILPRKTEQSHAEGDSMSTSKLEATLATNITLVRREREVRPHSLEQIEGQEAPREIALERPQVVIGRSNEVDVRLSTRRASRQHATLIRRGTDYMICDNESHNGIFLNGIKIHSAILRDGDIVQIADCAFIFREG